MASYWSATTPFDGRLRTLLAAALVGITVCGWAQILLAQRPAFLPTRADWQNLPYGSIVDIIGTWINHPPHRPDFGNEFPPRCGRSQVTQTIDAIFIIGETFPLRAGLERSKERSSFRAARPGASIRIWD